MRKAYIVNGLVLAGFGLLLLLPSFFLSMAGSGITKTSDVTNVLFNSISDISQNDSGTSQVIEGTKKAIGFFEAIPYFLIAAGAIIVLLGFVF